MARCNKTYFAILGLINTRGPISGYDIKKILLRTSDWYWSESNAQIYPMLKQLQQRGSVSSKLCQASGARQRRIYSITPLGKEKLITWLLAPIEPSPKREELLLKMRFGSNIGPLKILAHVQHYHAHVTDKLSQLDSVREIINDKYHGKPDHDYLLMTYDYAELVLKAKAKWCKAIESKLEKKANNETIEG